MKILNIITIVGVLFLTNCTTLKVYNVKDINEEVKGSHIYYLPKTVIKVEIETTKKITKKGPYSDYAEKFLGIKYATDNDIIEYSISDININSFAEPDSNQIYLINTNNNNIVKNINLSNDGILLSFNEPLNNINSFDNSFDKYINFKDNNKLFFTNLSTKKYVYNVIDTSYKVVKRDSIFIRVPVISNKTVNKTIEDKAEEIANIIIDLREEKISLISGDYTTVPQGNALKELFEESNRLQEEYLALFVGKSYVVKSKSYFYIIPDSNNINNIDTICFFSNREGISSDNLSKNNPITIQISKQGITNPISKYQIKYNKDKSNNGIFYRIPDIAEVILSNDNNTIASKKMLIAQYGIINMLPAKLFKNCKTAIQFYPATGALNSIK